MPSKREILGVLTRQALLDVSATLEITGLTGKPKDEIVETLAGSHMATAERCLEMLSRDELKAACRNLGLDDGGREKQKLVARLLGRDGATDGAATSGGQGRDNVAKAKKKNEGQAGLFDVEDYRHKGAKRKVTVHGPP